MRPRYLRPSLSLPDIYLYRPPIDFRKQANSLAALVELELGHNPFSGALYAFTNRHQNRIKCLMWEDNGFVLYYKALAEENSGGHGLGRPDFAHRRADQLVAGWLRSQPDAATQNSAL
ncbi:MAG: IS66 family insertion sequence element accessory protein TnpB [Hahellaceae bacterium]|nr:IS66 family insertion sequence element accessory protein TnpB [Hahellaceae bacterium]